MAICRQGGECCGAQCVEARNAAGHPLMHRAAPSEEPLHPRCQGSHGYKALPCICIKVPSGEGDGREVQEGGDICIPMADLC